MTKLGFHFAPIDVDILNHPKMKDACAPTPEHPAGDMRPFGLWCWCVTYVTGERTHGRVTLGQIRSAPGGLDNDDVAAKLVASGLFIALHDGGFEVFNHAKKLPKLTSEGRTPNAARQKRHRDKKKQSEDQNQALPDACGGVTESVTRNVTPSNISPSQISSGDLEVLREPSSAPRADDGFVRSDLPLLDDARAKYATYTSRNHLDTTVEDCWDGFTGHYASQRFGGRDGVLGKFQHWLTRQGKIDAKARAERRTREERDAARDATFAARFPPKSDVAPMTPYRLVDRDERPEPTAEELAEVKRLAAKGLTFLDAADNDAPKPTGTE